MTPGIEQRARGAARSQWFPIGLAIVALASTACFRGGDEARPSREPAASPADDAQDATASVSPEDRIALLEEEIRLREEFVLEYAELLDGVIARLDRMTGTKSSEALDAQNDPIAIESAVDARLKALERKLQATTQQQAVSAQTKGKETAEQKALAERQRLEIRALETRGAELQAEVASLRDRAARAEARAKELEAMTGTFVIAASPGELRALKRADVVRRGGGISGDLEMSPKALGIGATERTIKAIDGTAKVIYLGARVATARVVSGHRNYPDLFSIDKREGQLAVVIRDPVAFWRVSRYLIVEVEGA